MKTAIYQYRCRRCQELFEDGTESNEYIASKIAEFVVVMDMDSKVVNELFETSIFGFLKRRNHWCEDKGYGVADFAGYYLKEEDAGVAQR